MKTTVKIGCAVAVLLLSGQGWGQEGPAKPTQTAFSLEQAVAFGLANNVQVRNAQTDYQISRSRVGEISAAGLPQITGSAGFSHAPNKLIQRFVLEHGVGTESFSGVDAQQAGIVGRPFGLGLSLPTTSQAGLQLNQLLFSGSYLLGLKAARVYTELTSKQVQQARISLKASVTKAYYQAMVGQEQIKILDYNIARLDTSLREMQAMLKGGYVEQIDLNRLEVQRNNLLTERDNARRLVDLALAGLKFSMGYPVREPLTLTESLANTTLGEITPASSSANYDQRIEYSILKTNEMLARLDVKNKRAGYLPTLLGSASLGANSAANQGYRIFSEMFSGSSPGGKWEATDPASGRVVSGYRWYASASLGIQLNVPIFDGFEKRYQVQQANLTLRKVKDSQELVRSQIDLEVQQANISVANAAARLQTQQRNLVLAKEVVRVSRIKYRQGVGASLEVTNAETDLRVAQTNYYTALYDALVAKVDEDVATGRITGN